MLDTILPVLARPTPVRKTAVFLLSKMVLDFAMVRDHAPTPTPLVAVICTHRSLRYARIRVLRADGQIRPSGVGHVRPRVQAERRGGALGRFGAAAGAGQHPPDCTVRTATGFVCVCVCCVVRWCVCGCVRVARI